MGIENEQTIEARIAIWEEATAITLKIIGNNNPDRVELQTI